MTGLLEMKSALVTGGASGIGRATALAMAREGARVTVADLHPRSAAETVELINQAGGQAVSLAADVTDPDQVSRMVQAAVAAHGPLHCAFNNAGVAPHQVGSITQRSAEWSEASFDRMIAVNLKGVWLCMKYEITQMLAQATEVPDAESAPQASGAPPDSIARSGGAIVNAASIAGLVGLARGCAYVAAKHGVVGLTRTAALEYAADGIRINAVCPGFITTRMTAVVREHDGGPILARTPMRRFGTAEEVAELVVWLCSDRAGYVTGAAYALDGGWTAA